ncbi:hypothetical protein SacazDRAFT_01398 [Saccharomonospora azurea NA-128]|uniref:Chitinase n=1 Tax=Saccharomonospora azurea NA-128 TaxID=882081 RepID=H8G789_9PSEU|nr:hypothetical protein SacazDRAFT_01398 [Saccharomonospora azurea NA-128]
MYSVVRRTSVGPTSPVSSPAGTAPRTPILAASVLFSVLLLAACAPTTTERKVVVAPYVYAGARIPDLTAVADSTGIDRFVLSFLLADDGRCAPSWNGSRPVTDPALTAEVNRLRDRGGAVTVASGGAGGQYLEATCDTPEQLAAAYGSAVTALRADSLDVDVEQHVSADLVADALRIVRDRHAVALVVTVPVRDAESGLTPASVHLLRALRERELDVTVNAMVMNFPQRGEWSATIADAAERVTDQIQRLWEYDDRADAYARLGLTYMAGRNDTGAVTTLADARALRELATARSLAFLGFWSLNRDNGACPGQATVSSRCSGLGQHPHAFTRSLMQGPRSDHHQAGGNES